MSLRIESYKLVGRNWVRKFIDDGHHNCYYKDSCLFCLKKEDIKFQFEMAGFNTFNKNMAWWRITFDKDKPFITAA